jgi:D-glycero-alpha-D-manno-heptose-7-phosphate kinase
MVTKVASSPFNIRENEIKNEIIRSKSPLRISFGGGGTDVPPYPEEHGGCVLSCTIDKYCYASIMPCTNHIELHSLDYDIHAVYEPTQKFDYDGKLDLVKGVLNVMDINEGAEIFLHSDVPTGSGLGSSSAMVVALVGSANSWKRTALTNYEIAEMSYHIEREEVGIKGGKQDQYAAVFGGFNYIEFNKSSTIVNPLRVSHEILNELQYRLILCYTGKRRLSAGIIDDQISRYQAGNPDTVSALHITKRLASDMKNALLLGKLNEFGELLEEGWLAKCKFSDKMTDPDIEELYAISKKNGAIGGKLLGAGGGGYFLLLCEHNKWHEVAEAIIRLGLKKVDFAFEFNGLQTWKTNA